MDCCFCRSQWPLSLSHMTNVKICINKHESYHLSTKYQLSSTWILSVLASWQLSKIGSSQELLVFVWNLQPKCIKIFIQIYLIRHKSKWNGTNKIHICDWSAQVHHGTIIIRITSENRHTNKMKWTHKKDGMNMQYIDPKYFCVRVVKATRP